MEQGVDIYQIFAHNINLCSSKADVRNSALCMWLDTLSDTYPWRCWEYAADVYHFIEVEGYNPLLTIIPLDQIPQS